MSPAHHTPAPWEVSAGCAQFVVSEGRWIASTMGVRGEEGAANARLIAAAPELLEALIEARAALHQHYVDWDGEPEDAVPLQLARAACDAAIAKARGA